MKNIKFILIIVIVIVTSCVPVVQELCPNSYMTSSWVINNSSSYIQIVDREDGSGLSGNKDEPYILSVGFRGKLGKPCSSRTVKMTSSITKLGALLENDREYIPNNMISYYFPGFYGPKANIPDIINHINTEGLEITGVASLIFEEDNWPEWLKQKVLESLQLAIQATLTEVVETGGVINETELKNKLTEITGLFNLKFLNYARIFLGAWLDGDDDLISAEVKLCVNLPSDIFKLLGINLNDMKINVNVGEALNSALEEIDNGIAKSYFVRNKMTNSQGIIQVKLSIRGIEPEYLIQAPPSYRFDTLWNQSNNIVAIYERGNSTYARYCESTLGDNRIKVDKVSSCNGN